MAYDASQNSTFFSRVGNLARSLQDNREECARLVELWNAEAVSGDPDFVAVGANTTQEATDMITLCQAFDAFFDNAVVSTADRKTVLTPFLAN